MKLRDVYLSANTGLDAIKRAPIVDYKTGIKCIRIQDISQDKDYDDWGETDPSDKDYKKFKLQTGDILVARTGATVGVSYIVKENYNAVYNNGTIRIRFKDIVDTDFIYHLFQTKEFNKYIDNVSCVSTQPNLKIENLLRFDIPKIDKSKQVKIAHLLSLFDDITINNKKKISILENEIKYIYELYFSGNQNGEIRLGSLIKKYYRGISYSSEDLSDDCGINLVNLKNISSYGGYRRDGLKKYIGSFKEKNKVEYGDIIMGITDMTQDRRTVGHVALVPKYNDVSVISADLIKIVPNTSKLFLYCLLRYGNVSKYISQFANGANVLHLRPDDILKIKVPKYDDSLVKKFEEKVEPIFEQIEVLNQKNELLIMEKNELLPKLIYESIEL